MSGYILCQGKRARFPYYIENISTNIYTLEELCYYCLLYTSRVEFYGVPGGKDLMQPISFS